MKNFLTIFGLIVVFTLCYVDIAAASFVVNGPRGPVEAGPFSAIIVIGGCILGFIYEIIKKK